MLNNAQNQPTLRQLARGCRIAQKRYFADRCPANLQISKAAERLLDKALAQLEAAHQLDLLAGAQ